MTSGYHWMMNTVKLIYKCALHNPAAGNRGYAQQQPNCVIHQIQITLVWLAGYGLPISTLPPYIYRDR